MFYEEEGMYDQFELALTLDKKLGSGGQANVYKGSASDGKQIAVKIFNGEAQARKALKKEVDALIHLQNNPNII